MIGPHIGGNGSCWYTSYDNLFGRFNVIFLLNVFQMSSCNVWSFKIKLRIFVWNRWDSISLMETAIAICKNKLWPWCKSAFFRICWQHSLRSQFIQHIFGTAQISFAPLVAILNCLTESLSTTISTSSEKYYEFIFLLSNVLIYNSRTSIQAFCLWVNVVNHFNVRLCRYCTYDKKYKDNQIKLHKGLISFWKLLTKVVIKLINLLKMKWYYKWVTATAQNWYKKVLWFVKVLVKLNNRINKI